MGMVTERSGASSRVTLTATLEPSSTVYAACSKPTFTSGTSSSVMVTTVSLVPPADTPAGSVPKVSLTDSPSSSTVSDWPR